MNVVLNPDLARQGATTGATLAAAKADRTSPGWSVEAREVFLLYARMHRDGFMTEDVRQWAQKLGMSEPPDNRAWGYVALRLSKDGVIESVGYGRQRSSTCHGSPKTIWKLKQQ